MTLKQEYQTFIAKVRKDGGRLLKFPCPCCQKSIETLAAPAGAVWDSLTTCPWCECVFIKVVTATRVETATPGEKM